MMTAKEKICLDVRALLNSTDKRIVIGIDGPSGSGKTTLAKELEVEFGATVFHVDDFFLPKALQTEERLNTIGGNFDKERLFEEIISHLTTQSEIEYRPFSCKTQKLSPPKKIVLSQVVIIEGVYSCHPHFWQIYDKKYFLCIDKELQKKRVLERSPDKAELFFSKWIPLEDRYFEAFNLKTELICI